MSNSEWPMPKFHYQVDFDAELKGIAFQEVSGLDTETQKIEYRHGDSHKFSTISMPGISKHGNATMKRGVFVKDAVFFNWYEQIKMNTIKKRTVLIKLLDESGRVTMQWTLNNAWPTKITGMDLESDGNEVAVDTLEMAHEGLTVSIT